MERPASIGAIGMNNIGVGVSGTCGGSGSSIGFGVVNNRSRSNYKDIYDLLERLCKSFGGTPTQQRELLRHVTQYISNCPHALGNTLPYDEATLVANITQRLRAATPTTAATSTATFPTTTSLAANSAISGDGGAGDGGHNRGAGVMSNASLFLSLHEQLKASQLDLRQRSALLTFLFFMGDSKYSFENGYSNTSHSITHARRHHSTSPVRNAALQAIRSQLAKNSYEFPTPTTTSTTTTSIKGVKSIGGTFGGGSSSIGNVTGGSTSGSGIGISRCNFTPVYPHKPYELSTKLTALRGATNRISSDSESLSSATTLPGNQITLNNDLAKLSPDTQLSQNDEIVQNVIYSFTGIEGKYLRKDVVSGKFKLDVKVKTLNVVQAGMMLRLSELGYYHDRVRAFTDTKSGLCALGLMGQGFISALRHELTLYYGMVAMLQEQLNRQRTSQSNSNFSPGDRLTLLKVLAWSIEPLQRLRWLSIIAEKCQEKKGGALASTVHSFLSNGSPMVKALTRELLLAVCGPLYQMLSRWLLEGEIWDPHSEFFIECLNEVGPDRLWHDKYRVRTAMLPNFIPNEMAHKILVAGKSINFLCEICQDKQPVKGRDELRQCIEANAEHIFSVVADTKLHSTIDAIYLNTSKRVLDIVVGPHKLLDHMQAMRRYLLLGQGDFIGILMENLKSELDKPAKELYSYDLSSIMDAAIRSTNAQYDDPEILNHLDVRLMTPCDGDIGWDILSLQYTVPGALTTILDPSMGIYQVLFKPLWRMKHMEFVLSAKIWKDQMCNTKPLRPLAKELKKILYRLHLFTSEMIHFIHQMQYYILFEVIECSWAELQDRVQHAKALDDILDAHADFLNTIKCGAFLDSNSRELCQNLETVYEGIVRLEVWQNKFYDLCFKELAARKQYAKHIVDSEQSGKFGVTSEKQLERDQEQKIFEQTLHAYHKSLENIGGDYEKAVRCFLLALNSNNDHNLQLFGIRLDFNEYYKKRDQRLCVPLTFEHMRMSSVFHSNANKSSMHGSRYSSQY